MQLEVEFLGIFCFQLYKYWQIAVLLALAHLLPSNVWEDCICWGSPEYQECFIAQVHKGFFFLNKSLHHRKDTLKTLSSECYQYEVCILVAVQVPDARNRGQTLRQMIFYYVYLHFRRGPFHDHMPITNTSECACHQLALHEAAPALSECSDDRRICI